MIPRALRWLPAAAAAAYLATMTVLGPELVRSIAWSTDNSGFFALAERLRGSGPVYLPHAGAWTSLWWLLATRSLPGHRALWEATGSFFFVAGAALVGWATARVAGRWAGVAAAATAIVVVGPFPLRPLMTVTNHADDPFTAALFGAYLLLLTRTRSWVLAVAVGFLGGANTASDPLLWIAAVVPFAVGAAVLAVATRRPDIARRAGLTLGVTVVVAVVTEVIMRHLGYRVFGFAAAFAHPGDLPANMRHLARIIALLGGANFAFEPGYPREPVRAVVALLAVAGVGASVVAAAKVVARYADPERRAFACYWGAVTVLLCVSFVATPNGLALGPLSVTYLMALAPAVGVGVALLAARSRAGQVVAALGIAIVGAVNVAGLVNGRADGSPPLATYKAPMLRLLENEHATRGFAVYWEAQNLSWQTGMRLLIAPVTRCGTQLCPYNFTTIRSWYEPRDGPTFLLVDETDPEIAGAPPFAARVRVKHRFGELTLYVFDEDIARHIRLNRD